MKLLLILASVFAAFETIDCAKKMLHPAINICKRNDPNFTDCYCKNIIKLMPIIKNGVPEMNIVPIDPAIVENIRMDFTQTQSVKLIADMINVKITGISELEVKACTPRIVDSGLESTLDLTIPVIKMQSKYKAKGNFLLVGIDTTGDFSGEFRNLYMKTYWNTTKYMKKGKEHLKFETDISELKMKDIKVKLSNLLGNQTELNDNINKSINENADVLYEEIKPIILQTIQSIMLNVMNNVYGLFPTDVLFPKN